MSLFPIHIHEEGKPLPVDPICYIIAKEGIFMKKSLGIMDSIAKVDNISILQSIQTSAKMNIPKLPVSAVGKTFAFFREVYKEHSSEAVVIIFYNSAKRSYKIIPPLQKVSGAGLSYDRDVTCEGYDKIGSIHSHANFSAFHSGVDDSDEWSFDGLHITFGHCGSTDGTYTIAASICSNKQRFVVNPEDYINGIAPYTPPPSPVSQVPTYNYSGTKHYRMEGEKLVEFNPYQQTGGHYTYNMPVTSTYDKRYKLLATPKQMNFPKDVWMKLVEKQSYSYVGGFRGGMGAGMYGEWGDWYDGFNWAQRNNAHPSSIDVKNRYSRHTDPDAWKNNRHVVIKNGRVCIVPGTTPKIESPPGLPQCPQNVGVKVSPIQFPPHEIEDFNPCVSCLYRDEKIDWVIKTYTEEVEDDYDVSKATDNHILDMSKLKDADTGELVASQVPDVEGYYCEVCKRVYWIDEKDKRICPVCQSPMFKYEKEEEMHKQSSVDSGSLLVPDGDEFEKAVLEAAKQADTERFLLPEPDKNSVPINGRPQVETIQNTPRFSIRKLLQICKGKKDSGRV
jgi:hypothetical protein